MMLLKSVLFCLLVLATLLQFVLLQSDSPFGTLALQITKLRYLDGKFADGSCCDQNCDVTKCQGFLYVSFFKKEGERPLGRIPTDCQECNVHISLNLSEHLTTFIEGFAWSILDQNSGKVIDMRSTELFPTPYTVYGRSNTPGQHGRVELGNYLKLMCVDRYGPLCVNRCKSSDNSYCDLITGDEMCLNGKYGSECNFETSACESNPCRNLGVCISHGKNFQCICPQGFSGVTCESTGCDGSSCNAGVCANGVSCKCDLTRTGTYCEMPVCPPNYCGAYGTCSVEGGVFRCTCQENKAFGGVCEHVCKTECLNGGRCDLYSTTPGCVCPTGRTGPDCSSSINTLPILTPCYHDTVPTPSDDQILCGCGTLSYWKGMFCETPSCSPKTCHHGNCLENKRCVCSVGFGGEFCNDATCVGFDMCQNGGECVVIDNLRRPKCNCVNVQYTGEFCQLKCPKECNVANGRCDVVNGRVQCRCNPGFGGETCSESEAIGSCVSNPCVHGTCSVPNITRLDSYVCACQAGWIGINCEKPACTSDTCIHGVCASANGCHCYEGYAGNNCEQVTEGVLSELCQKSGFEAFVQGQFTACQCDPQEFVPPLCDLRCEKKCVNGFCGVSNDRAVCKCNAGFFGTACDSTVEFPEQMTLHIVYIVLIVLFLLSFIPSILLIWFFKKRDETTDMKNSRFMHPVDRKVKDVPIDKVNDLYGTSGGDFVIKPLTLRK